MIFLPQQQYVTLGKQRTFLCWSESLVLTCVVLAEKEARTGPDRKREAPATDIHFTSRIFPLHISFSPIPLSGETATFPQVCPSPSFPR
jgi:hypothetical protein